MRFCARTDRGSVRSSNQDAFGIRENLYLVADGMGGHRGGEVASRVAVEEILAAADIRDPLTGIRAGFAAANQAIRDHAASNAECEGMGTTVAALILSGEAAYLAHIGDSRIYRHRGQTLELLTRDHSLVEEMVRQGTLSAEDARVHPQRSILTRALGTTEVPRVEYAEIDLAKGDIFLLCTDGLTVELTDDEIGLILGLAVDPAAKAERLVSRANERGGVDNITVVVVEHDG